MTALLLSAVGGTRVVTGIATTANLLLTVVFLGEDYERRLDHTTTKTKDQVEGGLLLDVLGGVRR